MTDYHAIVTVRCDTDRDDVQTTLEKSLGTGHYLFRAEGHDEFTVTAQVVADDPELAETQAQRLVSDALVRAGVNDGNHVVGAEIRA